MLKMPDYVFCLLYNTERCIGRARTQAGTTCEAQIYTI
jgi:hypothetical protein